MSERQPFLAALSWQSATVLRISVETPRVKTFALRLARSITHKPGQHLDVRLTAQDGYQAQRSYSIASAPEHRDEVELGVELIADGEVSPFFHDILEVGDTIEVRGPIGGPFTWTAAAGGPLLLVGAGSGVVPLICMLRHRANVAAHLPALLLYSSRSPDDVIYRAELERWSTSDTQLEIVHTFTRVHPEGYDGYTRRVDDAMLRAVMTRIEKPAHVYVCGSSGFVQTVANALVALGLNPAVIHTEQFGPSGP